MTEGRDRAVVSGRVGARLCIPRSGCKESATLHKCHGLWVGWLRLTKLKTAALQQKEVWWLVGEKEEERSRQR